MKLTDEQWAALEELCSDVARLAGMQDPMPWDDSPLHGQGIRSRLAEILDVEPQDQREVMP